MIDRRRFYKIIQPADEGDRASRAFDWFILIMIALNVACVILESMRSLREAWGVWFDRFEVFSVIVFTVEYLLRLAACVENPMYSRPILGRVKAAFSGLMLIDLLAILPFYLPFMSVDLRSIRSLRMFRVFRIAKVTRYSKAMQTLGRVFWSRRSELAVAGYAVVVVLILSSSLMYYVENETQPEAFSSIPRAMWWTVATITTVGYGDVYPLTPMGKLLGSIIAFMGIGMFAVPTGILGAGFLDEIRPRKRTREKCPHCGKELNDNKADDHDQTKKEPTE